MQNLIGKLGSLSRFAVPRVKVGLALARLAARDALSSCVASTWWSHTLPDLRAQVPRTGLMEAEKLHESKVCSVLLPIYAASKAQKHDVYKGYDKITNSPTHKWSLPSWKEKPGMQEKVDKYRGRD